MQLHHVFCLFLAVCSLNLYGQSYEVIEDKARLPLLNPTFAQRQTLKIRLQNGLEAYIVSDPVLHESAAALTVRVGSWDEPENAPGMAHFLEHLLFLGTKTYPDENEYSRYIAEHDGESNAFTTSGYTSYMFAISNEAFAGGLDRFSKFFSEPLFNESGVLRELNAIDQEYAQNIQKDDVREYYVLKHLSKPHHPNHHFSMGNSETLSKVTRDDLIQWYQSHYSSNLMSLIIISALPIETLRDLVIKNFSSIPNLNKPLSEFEEYSIPDNLKGKMFYIEPMKSIRQLSIAWELPKELSIDTDQHPEIIACQVIGHEGPESLLAQLKKEGLADSIQCGGFEIGPKDKLFSVEVGLTPTGLNSLDTVIERVYQSIADLRQRKNLDYIYDELKGMETIEYQYQDREDLFTHIMKQASWIADESMESYPENARILQKWNPNTVQQLLEYLTPQRALYMVSAPQALTGLVTDQEEPWLNVKFAVKDIPPAALRKWEEVKPHPAIDLPPRNPFIPKHLKLNTAPDSSIQYPIPEIVYESPQGRIYFAPDTYYGLPEVYWEFHLKTPHIKPGNPISMVLGDLLVRSLNEALNPYSYPATTAGLTFSINRENNGIGIKLSGYSENIAMLLADILKYVSHLPITEEQFLAQKEILARHYQNSEVESPLKQASETLKSIVYEFYSTHKQKAHALTHITLVDFQEFYKHLFDSIYVEGLLYGNMTKTDAVKLGEGVIANFSGKTYPLDQQEQNAVVTLPQDRGPFYLDEAIRVQGNAALLAIEYIDFSFKARAAQQVLIQAMGDAFFATLRTRQQTGYLVTTRAEEIERKLFNVFAVQSNSHDVRDLLARFELFIEGFLQEIRTEEVPRERFENIRRALLASLEQLPRSISEMGALLNRLLEQYDADFHWQEKRIEGMRTLTYEEFLNYARDFLGRQNRRRLAILLKGSLPESKLFSYELMEETEELRNLSTYSTH